jgi:hypothetical protein
LKYNIVQLQFYLKGYLNVTPLCDVLRSSHTETKKKGGSHKVIHILIRLALYPFTAAGGAPGARPPPKMGKNMIFWRKIVIFHTKNSKNVRASLRSAQFLNKLAIDTYFCY